MKEVTLEYREGSSDKVYSATIAPEGDGYVVNFQYGRRGSALTTGTKTSAPVDMEKAEKIFDKLVKEKTAKGYKVTGASASQINVVAKEDTGLYSQLLNPIEEEEAERLLKDPEWLAQEKYDGRRIQIKKIGRELIGANRKGQRIAVPSEFDMLKDIPRDFVIDAENMGSYLAVFDLLSFDGVRLTGKEALERFDMLEKNFSHVGRPFIVIHTATTTATKQRLFNELLVAKAEGIVFKRKDSPYVPGRPASGGNQLKYKFYATSSFVVLKVNDQRSVLLGLYSNGKLVPAGNCTIPVNFIPPKEKDIVEVRYLYAFKESGSVYQPVYLGKRDDVSADECTVDQLKFKSEE